MVRYILILLAVAMYTWGRKLRREKDPIKKAADEHLQSEERARQVVPKEIENEVAASHSAEVNELLHSLGCTVSPSAGPRFRPD